MSTLPDLTTSNAGYIAYWNAINDGGVGSITASDALSDSNIQNYTLYDNGFTAQYQIGFQHGSRNVTVRVKQDGWFVAYTDRTNQFVQSASSKPNGYYDIIHDWTNESSAPAYTFPINTLERSIHSLQSNLSNSASITYNSSDVGLYNYEYSSASTSTMFSTGNQSGHNFTSGLVYTSGTNKLYVAATGNGSNYVSFEGTTIENNAEPSSLNLLGSGIIPNSQTEYDMSGHNNAGNIIGSVLAIWS